MPILISVNNSSTKTIWSNSDMNVNPSFQVGYDGASLVGAVDNTNGGQALAYGNRKFVLVGSTGNAVSTDGKTFTAYTNLSAANAKIEYNGSIFLCIDSVTFAVNTSTDGITWTAGTSPTGFTSMNSIAVLGSLFCVAGLDSNSKLISAVSTDGSTWTTGSPSTETMARITPVRSSVIAFSGQGGVPKFVIGYNTTTSTTQVFCKSSTDGLTWTSYTVFTQSTTFGQVYNLMVRDWDSTVTISGAAKSGANNSSVIKGQLGSTFTESGWAGTALWNKLSKIYPDHRINNTSHNTGTLVSNANNTTIMYESTGGGSSFIGPMTNPVDLVDWVTFSTIVSGLVTKTASTNLTPTRSLTQRKNWTLHRDALLSAGRGMLNSPRLGLFRSAAITSFIATIVSGVTSRGFNINEIITSGRAVLTSYRMDWNQSVAIQEVRNILIGLGNRQWYRDLTIAHPPRVFVKRVIQSLAPTFSTSKKRFWGRPWVMLYEFGKWVGVKFNSSIGASSTDGATWTARSMSQKLSWSGIASNGSLIISMATGSDIVNTSPDGVTWTERTLPTTRAWQTIVSDGTQFVAVALNSDKCITTLDGITWTEYDMPAWANWTSVAWNGAVFAAVSDTGLAASSPDGITWTARSMPDNIQYNCVTWHLGQFTAVASGPTNKAAKSTDGITWSRITMPAVADWTSVGPGVGNPNA